jgi:hypothetical protein
MSSSIQWSAPSAAALSRMRPESGFWGVSPAAAYERFELGALFFGEADDVFSCTWRENPRWLGANEDIRSLSSTQRICDRALVANFLAGCALPVIAYTFLLTHRHPAIRGSLHGSTVSV